MSLSVASHLTYSMLDDKLCHSTVITLGDLLHPGAFFANSNVCTISLKYHFAFTTKASVEFLQILDSDDGSLCVDGSGLSEGF